MRSFDIKFVLIFEFWFSNSVYFEYKDWEIFSLIFCVVVILWFWLRCLIIIFGIFFNLFKFFDVLLLIIIILLIIDDFRRLIIFFFKIFILGLNVIIIIDMFFFIIRIIFVFWKNRV